ncbi:hypothetical protein Tco_1305952, partial [Tanacetum coccineum]
SAQPPPKDDEQSSKKPHDSDASASKQQTTESGHSKHSSDDVSKQDEGHISEERNFKSTNTVSPHIVKQSDPRCEFSV